jgi:phosphoribosylaminoimidazolecarboxamide formyltransferase/IMP cyclohydrolase
MYPHFEALLGAGVPVAPRRALVSVSDKTHLRELCSGLVDLGCELYATSSTRTAIEGFGLPVKSVESATGFPEILGGRVKTLHPVVFGGILARASVPSDEEELRAHGLAPFDVVVCNLYPFQETLARAGGHPDALAALVEKIDIGGVTLLRAAAKNLERVACLCDAEDYLPFLAETRAHDGRMTPASRARLAVKALKETAAYDAVISDALERLLRVAGAFPNDKADVGARGNAEVTAGAPRLAGVTEGPVRARGAAAGTAAGTAGLMTAVAQAESDLPPTLELAFRRVQPLRYGENPHQRAAFYVSADPFLAARSGSLSLPALSCFHGKELSYNNVLDVEHAVRLVNEFARPGAVASADVGAAAVIVKHNVPCGVGLSLGSRASAAEAYLRAFEGDKVSPFGGIVAFTVSVDLEAARALSETFLEVVVAPDFAPDAAELLQRKKNLRLVKLDTRLPLANHWQLTHVQGGLLVQEADAPLWSVDEHRCVTKHAAPAALAPTLALAYAVVKHVRSNAIVLARGNQTIAIAGGFTNRVDAVRNVLAKATPPIEGAVLASDAFFPFPDSIELLAGRGLAAIIQPGGSVQDESVIAACDALGIPMVFTGMRHFKH